MTTFARACPVSLSRKPLSPGIEATPKTDLSLLRSLVHRQTWRLTGLIGLIGQFRSTPKRFWTFLKSMKMVKTLPAVLRHEGRSATSDDQKAHLLNACFCSKFTQPSDPGEPFPPCQEAAIGTLNSLEVSPFRVSAILSSLDKTKSSGADGLSSMVLLQCADTLAIPLTKIFTKCISSGTYPQKWKEANIIPIHKKGRTDLAVNYRSVSLLPIVSKVFEKLCWMLSLIISGQL